VLKWYRDMLTTVVQTAIVVWDTPQLPQKLISLSCQLRYLIVHMVECEIQFSELSLSVTEETLCSLGFGPVLGELKMQLFGGESGGGSIAVRFGDLAMQLLVDIQDLEIFVVLSVACRHETIISRDVNAILGICACERMTNEHADSVEQRQDQVLHSVWPGLIDGALTKFISKDRVVYLLVREGEVTNKNLCHVVGSRRSTQI
jgi:hypothetical protein